MKAATADMPVEDFASRTMVEIQVCKKSGLFTVPTRKT